MMICRGGRKASFFFSISPQSDTGFASLVVSDVPVGDTNVRVLENHFFFTKIIMSRDYSQFKSCASDSKTTFDVFLPCLSIFAPLSHDKESQDTTGKHTQRERGTTQ